jgi:hypothetical protein
LIARPPRKEEAIRYIMEWFSSGFYHPRMHKSAKTIFLPHQLALFTCFLIPGSMFVFDPDDIQDFDIKMRTDTIPTTMTALTKESFRNAQSANAIRF